MSKKKLYEFLPLWIWLGYILVVLGYGWLFETPHSASPLLCILLLGALALPITLCLWGLVKAGTTKQRRYLLVSPVAIAGLFLLFFLLGKIDKERKALALEVAKAEILKHEPDESDLAVEYSGAEVYHLHFKLRGKSGKTYAVGVAERGRSFRVYTLTEVDPDRSTRTTLKEYGLSP